MKKPKLKLDKVNLEIFNSFIKNGKINYSKIGNKLGMSHVSIKNRFETLIKKKVIKPTILVNFSDLDYKVGCLLLEVGPEAIDKLEHIYKNCPRLIYSFNIIGEYNFLVIFFAEDLDTLETMMKSCMLYNLEGVRKSNILLFGKQNEKIYFPIDFNILSQINENTPCGTCCKYCKAFLQKRCVGCPASKYYDGPLKLT